jgi:hypothetical protein
MNTKTVKAVRSSKHIAILICLTLIVLGFTAFQGDQKEGQNEGIESGLDTQVSDEMTYTSKLSYELSYTYADGQTKKILPEATRLGPYNARGDLAEHPLSSNITTLLKLDEIAIGNLKLPGTGKLRVYDDMFNNIEKFHTQEFPAENEGGADMVKGNFDEDHRDELVVAYESDFLEGEDIVTMTQVTFFDDATTDFEILNTSIFWITDCSLAAGDFDGDGLDEVAMVGNREGDSYMAGAVFDDLLTTQRIHHLWDHIEGAWEESPKATKEHDIVTGDFNNDGRDELAIVGYYDHSLISWIWSWKDEPEEVPLIYHGMELIYTLPKMEFTRGLPSISSGNIDGDRPDELIVTTHDDDFKIHYRIYDDLQTNFEIIKIGRDNITIRTTDSATGDIDGDGIDEILLVGHHVANPVGRILDDANHDFAVLKVLDFIFDDRWYYWYNLQVKCGDVDADGIDEYVMLGQSWNQLHGELYDDLSLGSNNSMIKRWQIGEKIPTMALGDFDGDGLILEYTGEHEAITTPSIPIVVMAAPPVIEGSWQDSEESRTRFGITTPDASDDGHELSMFSELSISFEGEPIELPDGALSALLQEFVATETPIMANSQNISFEGEFPQDYVVYQNTTYDLYKYRILSWPANDERVGEYISINVPSSINIELITLTEFSVENWDGLDIGNNTFSHQVGNISSYKNTSERNTTFNLYQGWSSNITSVGQGVENTIVTIDLSKKQINEEKLRYGIAWDDSELMKDEGCESTIGLTSDMMFEVTIGKNTIFEGIVGDDQDSEDIGKQVYSYGMLVYFTDESEDGLVYLVVDYWVEGIKDHQPVEEQVTKSGGDEVPVELIIVWILVIFILLIGIIKARGNKPK